MRFAGSTSCFICLPTLGITICYPDFRPKKQDLRQIERNISNLCFGDECARAGTNFAEFALSAIIISDSRSLEGCFSLFFPKHRNSNLATSFQIQAQTQRWNCRKLTHKGDHMITFQFREKPFIHKCPEQDKKHRIFRFIDHKHFNISQNQPRVFAREREKANLGFVETCLTLEGLTMAPEELIREVEDWSRTEKIAKNNNNPRQYIDIVDAWIWMHESRWRR